MAKKIVLTIFLIMLFSVSSFASTDEIREGLKNRESEITITTKLNGRDPQDVIHDTFQEALEHTGVPNEGDYLKFQFDQCDAAYEINRDDITITYLLSYYTTAKQEEEVNQKIKEAKQKIEKNSDSELETIHQVYRYIRSNTKYKTDKDNKQRTAYASLIEGNAVCQGYALAMYRLLLEEGIDNRIVYGLEIPPFGPPVRHTWNIVRYKGEYFHIDVTEDDVMDVIKFGLEGKGEFDKSHIPKKEYAEEEFQKEYPISSSDKYSEGRKSLRKTVVAIIKNL